MVSQQSETQLNVLLVSLWLIFTDIVIFKVYSGPKGPSAAESPV